MNNSKGRVSSNRVNKPGRKASTNSKSSDRRLASGIRPESFLLSQQNKTVNVNPSVSPSPNPHQSYNSKSDRRNGKGNDLTLDEWDPKHFRLFVGNLGSDANDSILLRAFSSYPSLSKVKVPIDHKGENKGYGFVAFSDPNDYLKAFKELNGKYIGHNPCVLKKANDLGKKKKK